MNRLSGLALLPILLSGCDGCDDDSDPRPPFNAPTLLAATAASSSRIDLTWMDNTTNEEGFILERSLDGVAFAEVATLPADTTAYSDLGLFPSTSYFYRVKAFLGSQESGWSNVAGAVTNAITWTQLTTTGPPNPTVNHAGLYDPVNNRMIVYGGVDDTFATPPNVFSLPFTGLTWSSLSAATPPNGRYWHTAVYEDSNPANPRMLVFGGEDGAFSTNNEVWAFSFTTLTWATLAVGTPKPAPRTGATSIYDPVGKRMILFGGNSGTTFLNDVWELRLTGTGAPVWSQLFPAGSAPSAREFATAVYDAFNQRMILFGGNDGAYRNDTWSLNLSGTLSWSALMPAGIPPSARTNHTAIYDAPGRRMVVFGGDNGVAGNNLLNDVWILSLSGTSTWKGIPIPAPLPAPRMAHSAVYDSVGNRMVLFAGGTDFFTPIDNQVWQLGPF